MTAHAVDVTSGSFAREVLEASKTIPVVVDFWAPWCGPCRVLEPILEKLAAEYAGRIKLAKVNSDENQDLAASFGVRSIPDVMAFKDGKAVSHFMGALPESQVRAFIDQLVPSPAEIERGRAAESRAAGDAAGAGAALGKALALDPANDRVRLDLAELFIELKRLDEADALLQAVQPDRELDARREALRAGVAFARSGQSGASAGDLEARLAADPDDHGARMALASLHAGAGRYAAALDQLLEIVRRDKDWNHGEARKRILNIFNLAEDDAELVGEYRRRLARTLY